MHFIWITGSASVDDGLNADLHVPGGPDAQGATNVPNLSCVPELSVTSLTLFCQLLPFCFQVFLMISP